MDYDGWGWRPYVSVAERRRKAMREMEKRKKKGSRLAGRASKAAPSPRPSGARPGATTSSATATTPTACRAGGPMCATARWSICRLRPARSSALVSGSDIYKVVNVAPVAKARWKSICTDCAGAIDSLVELLQGRFSKGVMERICRQRQGLFPSPAEIKLSCSCPDWAEMCKHVAAVLYGIGARLDQQPELLFRLREVDEKELIVKAGTALPLAKQGPAAAKVLGGEDLSEIFGLDMAKSIVPDLEPAKKRAMAKTTKKKTAKKNTSARRQPRKLPKK